jgi:hypothetical protein
VCTMSSPSSSPEPSPEEADLMERSTKKQKGEGSSFLPQKQIRSYKDSLVCPESNWENHSGLDSKTPFKEEDSDIDCDTDDKYPSISLFQSGKIAPPSPLALSANNQSFW